MELETKLPVPDREARRVIEDNFRKLDNDETSLEKVISDIKDIRRIMKKNGIEDYPE